MTGLTGTDPVVSRLEGEDALGRAMDLRYEVFCDEQGVPRELERDEHDDTAVHFGVFAPGGDLVGTARMVPYHPEGTAKVGRVAVRRSLRGAGLGRLLMRAVEAEAERLGYREVVLDAQVAVLGFYAGLGYVAEGDEFLDAGIVHLRMRRRLRGG